MLAFARFVLGGAMLVSGLLLLAASIGAWMTHGLTMQLAFNVTVGAVLYVLVVALVVSFGEADPAGGVH